MEFREQLHSTAYGSAENNSSSFIIPGTLSVCPASLLRLGLDIGSTTIKAVILDAAGGIVYKKYARHYSDIRGCLLKLLTNIQPIVHNLPCSTCFTGSGSITIAQKTGCAFIQEVLACNMAIGKLIPDADIIVELGGEDAKLTYLTGGLEQRMNETCAGGTGAFIDQMAAFLGTDAEGLDSLALESDAIYPIASRCGVFAKSDVLPLLNEGCKKENIAASIMQAVVNQTIAGLAQGRPITGNVVFLGGPLHFIHSLQKRFVASLPQVSSALFPDDGHFFVAVGAALHSDVGNNKIHPEELIRILEDLKPSGETKKLPPLFNSHEQWDEFQRRHSSHPVAEASLANARGSAWLGIDCGSTTIKTVLIDECCRLLYSTYATNNGDPLQVALKALENIYRHKNSDLHICGSCSTGYGSAMLKGMLGIDIDEVETVAHLTAASFFDPNVTFVLDIGGQDIKCMHVKNGAIDKIGLNEACSAGCGSFIQNFANSLGTSVPEFVKSALFAPNPSDLGTRCTVFMNSRVKQAQKEGADIGNIAAGLSYSVVRNAIFKVMKISDASTLGQHVVAQGGAFLNDAILRALELELDTNVVRPPIAGLMGAFGAALIAKKRMKDHSRSGIISVAEIDKFNVQTRSTRCSGCANSCLLTISSLGKKRRFVSGNRCERGADKKTQDIPNLYDYKYKRLFAHYKSLPLENAPRGVIGIPRALNVFENFPLWFTLFTNLGFSVVLSSPSSKELYYSAGDTVPSQTVCYPAKLAHGHVLDLVNKGIKTIFFPCVQREQIDADFRHGVYNCPIVAGYSELLHHNMAILRKRNITFVHNFLPLDRNALGFRLSQIPAFARIPREEMETAVNLGFMEMDNFRADMRKNGEKALDILQKKGALGIVLAGHPYHTDPEIHHGIAELINSCGLGVLTEDSVSHLMPDPGPLRVVDQWAYHSRLYRAGAFASVTDNLAVLQLVSFGCGLDAVTSDQLEEIVLRNHRLYAQIKIDEGANLGPARIRIRSLKAAMRERQEKRNEFYQKSCEIYHEGNYGYPVLTPEMKHTHTLLVPQMSPLHFQFAKEIFASEGYDAVLLPNVGRTAIETGLRYVNNDACFPAIVVIGQLLEEINSGKHDPEKIALVISQTGGGCRATNYIAFLRKALKDAGHGDIPIASFSTSINGPGIRLTRRLLLRLVMAGHYGDALMRVLHRMRPYELEQGITENLVDKWSKIAAQNIADGGILRFQRNMLSLIREFDKLPLRTESRRPLVGLVGEILLKYHPDANNNAARIIEDEGGEAVVTDIMDFILYSLYGHVFNYERLAGSRKDCRLAKMVISFLEMTRLCMRFGFGTSRHFSRPSSFNELRERALKVISLGHQTGEGWLLGAEMVRMLESGVSSILCMQPFGCLPNHIVGKGLVRELRRLYPGAVITPLDYDPGASEVNQINRIKLMMRSGMNLWTTTSQFS